MKKQVEACFLFISVWYYWTPAGKTVDLINIFLVYTVHIALYPTQPGCPGDHAFLSTYTLVPKAKADFSYLSCFHSLSSKRFQPFLFLRSISTTIIWKAQTYLTLFAIISASPLLSLCSYNSKCTFSAAWLKKLGQPPLTPCFHDQVDFKTVLQGWRKLEFKSPEPWDQHPLPSGGFTCFHNLDSKIRTAWSAWFQVLVWHLLWQL